MQLVSKVVLLFALVLLSGHADAQDWKARVTETRLIEQIEGAIDGERLGFTGKSQVGLSHLSGVTRREARSRILAQ